MASDENIPPPVSSLRSKFEQLAATSSSPSTTPSESQNILRRKPVRVRSNSTEHKPERPQQLQYLDPKRVVSGPSDSLSPPQALRLSPSFPDLKVSSDAIPSSTARDTRTLSQPPRPPSTFDGFATPDIATRSKSLNRKPPPPPPPSIRQSWSRDNSVEETPVSLSSAQPYETGIDQFTTTTRSTNLDSSHTKSFQAAPLPPALPARPRQTDNSYPKSRPVSAAPDIDVSIVNNVRPPNHLSNSVNDSFSLLGTTANRPPPIPPRQQSDQSDRRRNSTESTTSSISSSINGSSSSSSSSNVINANGSREPFPPSGPSNGSLRRAPPPLPQRRSGSDESNEKPPLPRRRSASPPAVPVATRPRLSDVPPPRPPQRTAVSGLPPPPVRATGAVSKVPLLKNLHFPRHSSDESSSASEDEAHTPKSSSKTNNVTRPAAYDELPDSTNCSRRLPLAPASVYRSPVSIPLAGVVAVAGSRVFVASGHEVKLYDMTKGVLSGTITLDLREVGLEWKKDNRITAMEFRAGSAANENGDDESGRHLWCGTKDGHLFEFDIVEQVMTRVRYNIHSNVVSSILRHGRTMVTVDEGGKVLVWRDYADLAGGTPRVIRMAEKQGFIRLFNGLLWTSSGTGSGTGSSASSSSSSLRGGPAVRVYDVCSHTSSNKILTPSETLGAVSSGTVLRSYPNRVYLGHEGGYISIWDDGKDCFESGRNIPTCVHTLKVANSDILSLEGVVDKLWSGTRNGVINVYDVVDPTTTTATITPTPTPTTPYSAAVDFSQQDSLKRPWRLTNSWQAYDKFPVARLFVDPYSIAKAQALHVVSVARGGQLRFWDGLLGADWIEGELREREAEFGTFRPLNILICSWNTDAQKPETLVGNSANVTFLSDVLNSVDRPDIIDFGFQELIDLENRGLTAKTVLLGQKKNADGSISDKVSRSYRLWHDALVHAVRLAMPVDDPYVVLHTDSLVGLFSCIFVRQRQKALLRDSAMNIIKRGLGGRYGNKGAIVARFVFDDTSICFVNCHLAAGQGHVRARNRDVAAILEDTAAFPRSETPEALSYAGGGDGSMILDHEVCFLHGDLNYRIDMRRDTIINSIQNNDLNHIYNHDQLYRQIKSNPSFRLRSFVEPPLTFAPTYKYDRRTDVYDTSEKKRAPAWCDRILWHCREPSRVRSLHYKRYEVDVSDHRPISAGYSVTVKKIDNDARAAVKLEVTQSWRNLELNILIEMQEFYAMQQIL